MEVDARTDMSVDQQDCDVECDAPKTEIIKSSQDGWNSAIRTRSSR